MMNRAFVKYDIRTGCVRDAESILALWRASRSEFSTTLDSRDQIAGAIEHANTEVLVAEADGHIVGTVVVGWDGWRGNLYRIVVSHDMRRQGIGSSLASQAQIYLRRMGASSVNVSVGREDVEAMAFWQSLGYHHDSRLIRMGLHIE